MIGMAGGVGVGGGWSAYVWMGLYGLSCLLDAFDGLAARYLDQSTRFGAVLDMVTDRSTTSCLLVRLALEHPSWVLPVQLLISLDLSSHYMQMHSSLSLGHTSHKQVAEGGNPLLRLYYTSRTCLFLVCAGNELFFMVLWLLGRSELVTAGGLDIYYYNALSVIWTSLLNSISTLLTSLSSLSSYTATTTISPSVEVSVLSSWFSSLSFLSSPLIQVPPANVWAATPISTRILLALLVISFPVFAFKQIVNVIQLIDASISLADADRKISTNITTTKTKSTRSPKKKKAI